MRSEILLPDGMVLVVNGTNIGVAGYAGNPAQQAWSVDDGFGDKPALSPIISVRVHRQSRSGVVVFRESIIIALLYSQMACSLLSCTNT